MPIDQNKHIPEVKLIDVKCLDPRLQVFRLGDLVDSFVFRGTQSTIFIDTMSGPRAARQVVESAVGLSTPAGALVINTHSDWDHAWGNCLFDGSRAEYPAPILGQAHARGIVQSEESQMFLESMQAKEPENYASVELRPPSVEFESEIVVWADELSFHLIPTPGHTPDHVVVWIPEIATLIAGDAAEVPMPYVGRLSDLPALRSSLVALRSLAPRLVLYSHGAGLTTPEVLEWNIAYFDEAETRCRVALCDANSRDMISPASLKWPLEAVLPAGVSLSAEAMSFYRRSHALAVAAMASWVGSIAAEP